MSETTSKKITVKLQKINCSEDLSILALDSNYSPTETLNDLDNLLAAPEFISTLTETPQSFEIAVDDDYDVEPCCECVTDPCNSLSQAFKSGITMYRNLYILHRMAKGNDMMKLHLLSEEMYEELIKEIDTLGELLVEKCGAVPEPEWCNEYIKVQSYEFQESLGILTRYIQSYIDAITFAYPNQTSDVQSTLDEWLRYWNKQMNYFVRQQEA